MKATSSILFLLAIVNLCREVESKCGYFCMYFCPKENKDECFNYCNCEFNPEDYGVDPDSNKDIREYKELNKNTDFFE